MNDGRSNRRNGQTGSTEPCRRGLCQDAEVTTWNALQALDALDATQTAAFENHLQSCAACREEVSRLRATSAELGLTPAPITPPVSIRSDLMAWVRTSKQAPKRGFQAKKTHAAGSLDSFFLLGKDGEWESTSIDGIEARTLQLDEANDCATMLFRMAPGAAYPAHRHAGPEECYVLQGDLQVGDVTMQEGDYQFVAAGTDHPVQTTTHGCLLLIRTSLSDELLD